MTKLILPRRSFLIGLTALITAPAIVRAQNIMRVRVMLPMRGPMLEVFGFSGISGADDTATIIDSYSAQELEDIASRIMAAQIVIVR